MMVENFIIEGLINLIFVCQVLWAFGTVPGILYEEGDKVFAYPRFREFNWQSVKDLGVAFLVLSILEVLKQFLAYEGS